MCNSLNIPLSHGPVYLYGEDKQRTYHKISEMTDEQKKAFRDRVNIRREELEKREKEYEIVIDFDRD